MGFLFGAMKSISSNWAKSYLPEEDTVLEADLRKRDADGKEFSPLDADRAGQPNAEQQLSDRQTLLEIDNLFKDDQEAQMVLTAWQEGYDPSGVREFGGFRKMTTTPPSVESGGTLDAAGMRPDRDRGGMHVQ